MNKNFILCAFSDEADSSLDGQIKALRQNGIEYMEIRGVDGKNISEITIPQAVEIKKRLDEGGIKVWSIGSPTGKIDISLPFEPHYDDFCRMLETANIFGAKCYRLFSFYGNACLDKVLRRLDMFLTAADGSGVTLCHENEKDIYGDIASRCFEIHKNLPKLKAVFDPANFIQCGENVLTAWDTLNPYVKYLHIKDALQDGTVVPAGCGEGHIEALLENFKSGILSVEPHLHVFEGFSALESGNKSEMIYTYPSQSIAFKTAVDALKSIIKGETL